VTKSCLFTILVAIALCFAAINHTAAEPPNAQKDRTETERQWAKQHRAWLKQFRQLQQQNLQQLQSQSKSDRMQLERQQQEQQQQDRSWRDLIQQQQVQSQQQQDQQTALRKQQCLATCAAPTACSPGSDGRPGTFCQSDRTLCETQCR